MPTKIYNPSKIEKKWQKWWETKKIYEVKDKVKGRENFYHLVMFPYPSGDIHIGHWYNFVGADVFARLKKMQGFNVLSPIGFDAFGLPAENAAIKRKIHPQAWTFKNIKKMQKQLRSIGAIYDWSREIITAEPEYYKWTQWMFLQLYKKGLAYRKKAKANWCNNCRTVLANEQVIEGKCERCDSITYQKEIDQWLFKITDYAERLLKDIEKLDWPEKTKIMQKNWIGRSEGWEIQFLIPNQEISISIFTTRPDTLFGSTYMVLAPEHPLVDKLTIEQKEKEVERYREKTKRKSELERIGAGLEKTGVFIGAYALNPVTNERIPIWISDYVLLGYGTGAIMAVPAHDQRDFEFAKKFNLLIREVVRGPKSGPLEKAWEGEGDLINSSWFTGMASGKAKDEIGEYLKKRGLARKKIYYRLRDWIVSRQRYWGAPIPIIYCQDCGIQPVPENKLPVKLPSLSNFKPAEDGRSPLARSKKFIQTKCPNCHGRAERETDTLDTFVDSSWYYLRYVDPRNHRHFAAKKKIESWLPVKMYVGGAEHTVLHLLYSRFFAKALNDAGFINFKEPFLALRHQGIILGPDNQKMSKSRGNVVDPDELVKKFGSDAVRLHLCFMGPYDQGGPWNPGGIIGISRFLNRVFNFANNFGKTIKNEEIKIDLSLFHQLIKKIGEDIESFHFNTAVSSLMQILNWLEEQKFVSREVLEIYLKLLSPFAPHLSEELWHHLGFKGSIHKEIWPKYDVSLIIKKEVQIVVQVNGKSRDVVTVPSGFSKDEIQKLAESEEKVKRYLTGKNIKKVFFVPDRLINFVIE
ncbi:MAG: leucine--tRNA ligase [Parcubacteria group bacterium]|nr:leucine--tRNA ligase [Parcubacteria group bacterium]